MSNGLLLSTYKLVIAVLNYLSIEVKTYWFSCNDLATVFILIFDLLVIFLLFSMCVE